MARNLELWCKIRADFLATGKSYPQLAKEYGVNLSAIKRVAAKEKWSQGLSEVNRRVLQTEPANRTDVNRFEPTEITEIIADRIHETVPTAEEIIEGKRDRLSKFMEITDAMMDRILTAMQSPEVINPYSLKLLASTLRDLREMQGLNKSALDIEEQMARIAKLKSETKIVEDTEEFGVIVLPEVVEPVPPDESGQDDDSPSGEPEDE